MKFISKRMKMIYILLVLLFTAGCQEFESVKTSSADESASSGEEVTTTTSSSTTTTSSSTTTTLPPNPDVMTFSNRPSGMTQLTDTNWGSSEPASGWGMVDRDGELTAGPSSSSPSGGALRLFFPEGMGAALDPGAAFYGNANMRNAREVFVGAVMRFDTHWVPNANQTKLQMFRAGPVWYGIFDGCWSKPTGHFSIAMWGSGATQVPKEGDCWINNMVPQTPAYTPGSWVKTEWYTRVSSPGLADGIIRLWINGVLVLEHTNLRFPSGFEFEQFEHNGTYGGGGSAVPHDQSIYVARSHISFR